MAQKPLRNPFNLKPGDCVMVGERLLQVHSMMAFINCVLLIDVTTGERIKDPVPISHCLPAGEAAKLLYLKEEN